MGIVVTGYIHKSVIIRDFMNIGRGIMVYKMACSIIIEGKPIPLGIAETAFPGTSIAGEQVAFPFIMEIKYGRVSVLPFNTPARRIHIHVGGHAGTGQGSYIIVTIMGIRTDGGNEVRRHGRIPHRACSQYHGNQSRQMFPHLFPSTHNVPSLSENNA